MAKKKLTDHVLIVTMARNALNKLKWVAEPTPEAKAAHEALEAAMDEAAEIITEKREALLALVEIAKKQDEKKTAERAEVNRKAELAAHLAALEAEGFDE